MWNSYLRWQNQTVFFCSVTKHQFLCIVINWIYDQKIDKSINMSISTRYVLQFKQKIPLNIQIQFALAYVKYTFKKKNLAILLKLYLTTKSAKKMYSKRRLYSRLNKYPESCQVGPWIIDLWNYISDSKHFHPLISLHTCFSNFLSISCNSTNVDPLIFQSYPSIFQFSYGPSAFSVRWMRLWK